MKTPIYYTSLLLLVPSLHAAQSTDLAQAHTNPYEWTIEEVAQYVKQEVELKKHYLEYIEDKIREHGIDGYVFLSSDKSEIKAYFPDLKLGPRHRFCKVLEKLAKKAKQTFDPLPPPTKEEIDAILPGYASYLEGTRQASMDEGPEREEGEQ